MAPSIARQNVGINPRELLSISRDNKYINMKKNNNKIKTCAVYLRVSTENQKLDGLSMATQRELCLNKAGLEGYEVSEVIDCDEGISGFYDDRPGINHLQDIMKDKTIQAVVALDSSRLFRNAQSDRAFRNLAFKIGTHIIYVNEESPKDTADSKMTSGVRAEFNEYHRNQTSDKVKATLYAKANAGYSPAPTPLGYKNVDNQDPTAPSYARKIIEPDPLVAPIIVEFFQLYASGVHNVYDLTDWLNERGVRTRRGYRVASSVVYNILRNRLYIGEVKWGKAYCKKGKHKPIIDEGTFNRVQQILEAHNHKGCRRRKHQWLLAGFVQCITHRKPYTAEWHHKKTANRTSRAYYHCSNRMGCGKYIEQTELEMAVEEKFKNLQFSEEFINVVVEKTKTLFLEKRKTYEGRRAGLVSKRTALGNKRKVAEDKWLERLLSDEEFSRMRTELDGDLLQIDDELTTLEEQKGLDIDVAQEVLSLTKDIYKAYKQAPFNLKRQYLALFWEKFEAKDGVILREHLSPLFAELVQAEEAFYKNANSEKPEENNGFSLGIKYNSQLRV